MACLIFQKESLLISIIIISLSLIPHTSLPKSQQPKTEKQSMWNLVGPPFPHLWISSYNFWYIKTFSGFNFNSQNSDNICVCVCVWICNFLWNVLTSCLPTSACPKYTLDLWTTGPAWTIQMRICFSYNVTAQCAAVYLQLYAMFCPCLPLSPTQR